MSPRDQLIGELDLHLFAEGTHRRLWELLGPRGAVSGVRFSVWAPNARAVAIVGDWNDWQPEQLERVDVKGPTAVWSMVSNRARSGDCYKFEITTAEGRTIRKADPMARRTELPPSDASVVPDFDEYEWSDDEWMAERGTAVRGESPVRMYEVHLGSWRRSVDDWDSLAEQVGDHVTRLGFTHVELLPIAEHPYGGSWGYQVSGYYAPTARFGDPEGCRRFVDALHQRGIGVILDWVPAHFPKDDWSLGRFDGTPLYEHPDPQRGEHPDWGTYVFNFGRNEVRNFLVANALYWLDMFHIDGLRVDAVASMLYLDYSRGPGQWSANEHGGREHLEAIQLLQETTTVVGEEFPDVMMIAEESTAWPGVTRPVSEGGLGFSHKWNLGWMHDSLGYMQLDPVHRRHHHHELTFAQLYAYNERFVLPLSHDEVVHGKGSLLAKMGGDDWQKFAGLRALLAWQWSLPGAPLLFMGAELAPWQEWNDAAELPWHLLDHPSHRGVHDLIIELNRRSDAYPALWRRDTDPAGFQWLDAEDAEHSMFSFLRWDDHGAAAVACVANFTPVPRPGYRVGLPWTGEWTPVLDTDAATWWGSGHRSVGPVVATSPEAWQGQPTSALVDIGPMSMLWLASPIRR
ncbi:1,4-alpha-glucan branching protein GlgB [Ilumatobacter sp.]|uniref:1,4-alpha-glucan branching protein GlgB n=1 Tax=Ilumatobacter sp. TaxID=1967498 RepID=UPI003C3E99AB